MNELIEKDSTNLVLRQKRKNKNFSKSLFEVYKSPKTIEDYFFYLRDFLAFVYDDDGNKNFKQEEMIPLMKEVTKDEAIEYVNYLLQERELKKTSVNKIISGMKSLYKELEEYGVKNPFQYIKLFKTARNIDNILKVSGSDIEKIINTNDIKSIKDYRNITILYTLYYTGMRSDELLNLKYKNILQRDGEYFLKLEKTKSGKEQYKPLHSDIVKILQDYKKNIITINNLDENNLDENFIFCSDYANNKKMSYKTLYSVIKKMGLTIEKDISPHNIRHAIATELSLNGADLIEIRDFLGHSNTQVTEIYINAKTLIEKKVTTKIPNIKNK